MQWVIDHSATQLLHQQIAACVRRGVAGGELPVGEQLPPAAELAAALDVDRNTVLVAYRQLRDEGVLEFRRGRGVKVASSAVTREPVREAVRALLDVARDHGMDRGEVIRLVEELDGPAAAH